MVKRLSFLSASVLALSFLLPAAMPSREAPFQAEKRLAVRLASEARAIIGDGLIGVEYSEITTTVGHKDAKTLSTAADFPALAVQWLLEAGVKRGDAVAVNASGSFPALVIASLAATEAVGARPLLIASLGSSSWGANRPEFTWAHMETRLRGAFPAWKSVAMSLGGDGDEALGMSPEGRAALYGAITGSGVPMLVPGPGEDAVSSRMRLWKERNGGELPALLINIGGNEAFWGPGGHDAPAAEGLLRPGEAGTAGGGVGGRFHREGRPVIHLLNIKRMAVAYGISLAGNPDSPVWRLPDPPLGARIAAALAALACLAAIPPLARGGGASA